MSLTQTWSQSPTNELVAIHHLKRFCYTAHVFTSWSAVKENGLLFCAAKVCVSESPAQVGTHSFSDMERFTRIRKMSNNVKLSLQTTIRRRRKKKNHFRLQDTSDPHILWHSIKHDTEIYPTCIYSPS